MNVVVLAGGVGGARFLLGLRAAVGSQGKITAVVNTGDDITLYGLRVCPDLDTVMYTLGGGIDKERGWGRSSETWNAKEELAKYDSDSAWFSLGDKDMATHIARTTLLSDGLPLSAATAILARRWRPGANILPMTDQQMETHVVIRGSDHSKIMHFQEWWVRYGAEPPVERFVMRGAELAKPAPGVLDAVAEAQIVLVAPSNPVVSIGPILSVPGVREALRESSAPVIGISPIIEGAPVRGMADACLTAIGVETSAQAVGQYYGSRRKDGVLDGWLVDTKDSQTDLPEVEVRAVPLWMTDTDRTVEIANAALELARVTLS